MTALRKALKDARGFASLSNVLGVREAVRVRKQLNTNSLAVRFHDTGREYWMANDASAVYHLTESISKLRTLSSMVPSESAVVIDIGCHSGLFAAFAVERAPGAHVRAIEADPQLIPVIERNLSKAASFDVHNVAVSDVSGPVDFYRNAASSQSSSLIRSVAEVFGDPTERISIDSSTLDELCNDLDEIDVLKIDIQGTEQLAFDGGLSTLAKTRLLLTEITFLDPCPMDTYSFLKREFGTDPLVLNPVYMGADLAFVRK